MWRVETFKQTGGPCGPGGYVVARDEQSARERVIASRPGLHVRLYPMAADAEWPGEPGEAIHWLDDSAGFIRTAELTAENDDGQG